MKRITALLLSALLLLFALAGCTTVVVGPEGNKPSGGTPAPGTQAPVETI